ncbi:MAG: PKD domain-containing protein [bacterium]|jgi:PKD repeat protein
MIRFNSSIILSVLIVLLAAVSLSACSRNFRGGASGGGGLTPQAEVSLSDAVLHDLSAYEPPDGVDPKVFKLLADKLVEEIRAREEGRLPSQAAPASPPLFLVFTDLGDGIGNFAWKYYHQGDYNLDGEVSVADITPIALNYLQSVSDGNADNVQRFIDGDLSGEIGVSDITPIALNYLASYHVVAAIFEELPSSAWTLSNWQEKAAAIVTAALISDSPGTVKPAVNLDPANPKYGWLSLDFDIDAAALTSGDYYFGVRDLSDPCKFVSFDKFSLTGRDDPEIAAVSPTSGSPGLQVQFYADLLSGAEPLSYSWNFGGGANPDHSEEQSPIVTLAAAKGAYQASVTISNAYGSDTFEWELTVGEVPVINSVSPIGGTPGQPVTFSAEVAGEQPFTYSWDFGGGATPALSDAQSPTVSLADAKGSYFASLTVTNVYGSDTYEWILGVGDPPVVTGVSPLIGMSGLPGALSADVSGDPPFAFSWNFGGGAVPNSSADENPQVTFGDLPGDYAANLTVSNNIGSFSYDFTLKVIPLGSEGFTLFSPMNDNKTYLIDMDGNVVHDWTADYYPGAAVELSADGYMYRLCNINNPTFNGGGSAGRIEKRDWDGNLVWYYELSSSTQCCHHDFELMPNGNILLIVWNLYTRDEAIEHGRNPSYTSMRGFWADSIAEIEPVGTSGGEIVWEWYVWDHLIQDYDDTKNNFGDPAEHPELIDINLSPGSPLDWTHVNAVAYNEDLDQIVISPHSISEIWVIDHSTTTEEAAGHTGGRYGRGGDLIYRWGNPASYKKGAAEDHKLFYQHDPYWIPDGLEGEGDILILNNQPGSFDGQPYSSVVQITTPLNPDGSYYMTDGFYGPSEPTWEFISDPPNLFYSQLMSSAQRLPGGNTLVTSSLQRWLFEATMDGEIVWEYDNQFPSGSPGFIFKAFRYTPDFPGLARLEQ